MVNTRTAVIEQEDIIHKAQSLGRVKNFLRAIRLAGIEGTLRSGGPYTVFAPSDDVFYRLPVELIRDILADRANLRARVEYHIVPGRALKRADLGDIRVAVTLQGGNLYFTGGKGLLVNGTGIVEPDIDCGNGVIHIIDSILSPHRD